TVVLFKPDNSANGVTELQGVYGSGDFASTGDGKQVLDDKYWLVNTTHQTNIVAGGIIIGDLTIDALCMYNLSTTYILSSRSSGESAATDYNFEVRVSNSTDFTVFFEADTSNYTFVYELPDENGLKRNEPFWVKFIREDNGDGTANHYLLVKRIGDDDYKFLRVGSISDNTDTAELSPSGTYVTSDFSTDSSSNYLYFAQGTSPIRMISMKDSAIVPDHENASATYYSTVAAAVAAANSVAHEEGDLVGVSWEADDYTDAWSTYGTVQADGSISPDLLSFDGGIPFKALGFTFSTYDGDAIPLNGDGYPEFDTTVLTQYSALQVEGLTINGILDCEVHVETDLDSIPNDAANSIIGFGVIQQAPDSGDSYVGIRKVSGIIYRFFEQDDGETQQASLGITSLKGGLRFNTFIRNNSPLGTAEPNIYLGVQERSPDYTTSQASADWETRHGDWTSGDGPESIIVLYGYDSSVAGTGTGTFTRLRLTANSITYD
ncbi:MAG: hypothetical protein CL489_10190, partial [Acidobacteria bacterium]|nr:hypothetical protein [Acidobacteriota bacterium]